MKMTVKATFSLRELKHDGGRFFYSIDGRLHGTANASVAFTTLDLGARDQRTTIAGDQAPEPGHRGRLPPLHVPPRQP